eukprot:scaffold101668_cov37-Tisochrysis_lutea.AAC.3
MGGCRQIITSIHGRGDEGGDATPGAIGSNAHSVERYRTGPHWSGTGPRMQVRACRLSCLPGRSRVIASPSHRYPWD